MKTFLERVKKARAENQEIARLFPELGDQNVPLYDKLIETLESRTELSYLSGCNRRPAGCWWSCEFR